MACTHLWELEGAVKGLDIGFWWTGRCFVEGVIFVRSV